MQGLVDVGRMGCSSSEAHSADIHQPKDTLATKDILAQEMKPVKDMLESLQSNAGKQEERLKEVEKKMVKRW